MSVENWRMRRRAALEPGTRAQLTGGTLDLATDDRQLASDRLAGTLEADPHRGPRFPAHEVLELALGLASQLLAVDREQDVTGLKTRQVRG